MKFDLPPTQELSAEQLKVFKRCIRQLATVLPNTSEFILLVNFPLDRGGSIYTPVRIATNMKSTAKVGLILSEAGRFALAREAFQGRVEVDLKTTEEH